MHSSSGVEAFEGAHAGSRRVPASWNDVPHRVIGCAMRVHTALGPGMPERLYAAALDHELRKAGISFAREVAIRIEYDGVMIGELRLDLVVDGFLVVELKAVESVHDVHAAQLVSYLRGAKLPLGLLINFHVHHLRDGIYRRLHADALPD